MEEQPDVFFRFNASAMWNENVESAADFLGSDPNNLVFVNNTTTGAVTMPNILMSQRRSSDVLLKAMSQNLVP